MRANTTNGVNTNAQVRSHQGSSLVCLRKQITEHRRSLGCYQLMQPCQRQQASCNVLDLVQQANDCICFDGCGCCIHANDVSFGQRFGCTTKALLKSKFARIVPIFSAGDVVSLDKQRSHAFGSVCTQIRYNDHASANPTRFLVLPNL